MLFTGVGLFMCASSACIKMCSDSLTLSLASLLVVVAIVAIRTLRAMALDASHSVPGGAEAWLVSSN